MQRISRSSEVEKLTTRRLKCCYGTIGGNGGNGTAGFCATMATMVNSLPMFLRSGGFGSFPLSPKRILSQNARPVLTKRQTFSQQFSSFLNVAEPTTSCDSIRFPDRLAV